MAASHEQLLAKEKEATKAADALAAERRREPMKEVSTDFRFVGPGGAAGFLDLFEGRSQLILYHFWFPEGGKPCVGCSMVGDQLTDVAHVNARDTTFAPSRGRRRRISGPTASAWAGRSPGTPTRSSSRRPTTRPNGSPSTSSWRRRPRLSDLPDRGRAVEAIGTVWSLLDRTPLGRQEEWEDTPPGRPQTAPYGWWNYHDEYGGG